MRLIVCMTLFCIVLSKLLHSGDDGNWALETTLGEESPEENHLAEATNEEESLEWESLGEATLDEESLEGRHLVALNPSTTVINDYLWSVWAFGTTWSAIGVYTYNWTFANATNPAEAAKFEVKNDNVRGKFLNATASKANAIIIKSNDTL